MCTRFYELEVVEVEAMKRMYLPAVGHRDEGRSNHLEYHCDPDTMHLPHPGIGLLCSLPLVPYSCQCGHIRCRTQRPNDMVKRLASQGLKLCTDRDVAVEEAKLLGSVTSRDTPRTSLDEVDGLVQATHHVKPNVEVEQEKHVEMAKLEELVMPRENWIEMVHKRAPMRLLAIASLGRSTALVMILEQ